MATALRNSDKGERNSICDLYYEANCFPAGSFAISGAENIR